MTAKGFFAISTQALRSIMLSGGDAGDLATYLVLANHTSGKSPKNHVASTAGARAVSNKTGLSYRQAASRLKWLEDNGLISSGEPEINTNVPRARRVRWYLQPLCEEVAYISHSLIEGVGPGKNKPPVKRLWDEISRGDCRTISDARADALLLLIHCYQVHQMQDFGGVDPGCVHISWREKEPEDFLEELNWLVMEIEPGGLVVNEGWLNDIFVHVPKHDRRKRFTNALSSLRDLGFIYEVIQVWDQNPLSNPKANQLYPLYVRDYHARQNEPYCLKETHKFLVKSGFWNGRVLTLTLDDVVGSGNFRLIRLRSETQFAVGTLRLRFRPNTQDAARWALQEEKRVQDWNETLEKWADKFHSEG